MSNVKIETGNLTTPDGTPYKGFKVTIGGSPNPERTYDDIEKILGKNNVSYKTHEERNPNGTFKSYSVST